MQPLLYVGLGGAFGSMLRFLCQRALNDPAFPYGTLTVNVLGCLLIGIFLGWVQKNGLQTHTYLLLTTGFCGGFTTFSAFTQESIQLLLQHRWQAFLFYTLLSVTAGLLATFGGYKLIT